MRVAVVISFPSFYKKGASVTAFVMAKNGEPFWKTSHAQGISPKFQESED